MYLGVSDRNCYNGLMLRTSINAERLRTNVEVFDKAKKQLV